MKRRDRYNYILLAATGGSLALWSAAAQAAQPAPSQTVPAQTAPVAAAGADGNAMGDIIVTARKRRR